MTTQPAPPPTTATAADAAAPARPVRRRRPPARRPRLRRRPDALERRRRPAPGRRRLPGDRRRGRRGRPGRRRPPGCGSRRRAPATTPARSATSADAVLLRTSAMRERRRSTPSAGPPGSAPARSGSTSSRRPRRTAWPRCTAPPPTSASSATPSAAASGWYARAARPGHQQRHRRRAGHRRRHAWCAPTPSTSPTCSGRSAAAAATSASSPRWSSGSSRSRPRTPACWSGTGSDAEKVLPRLGRAGPSTPRTRSPRRSGSCSCRRFEEIPPLLRGRQLVVIDGAVLGDDATAEADPRRRCARSSRRSTPSPGCRRRRWCGCTWTPRARRPASRATSVLGEPARRGDRRVPRAGRRRHRRRRCSSAELRQLGGALARPHAGAGALPMLDGEFVLFAVAIAATPEMAAAGPRRRHGAGRRDVAVGERPAVPQLPRGGRATPAPATTRRATRGCSR